MRVLITQALCIATFVFYVSFLLDHTRLVSLDSVVDALPKRFFYSYNQCKDSGHSRSADLQLQWWGGNAGDKRDINMLFRDFCLLYSYW